MADEPKRPAADDETQKLKRIHGRLSAIEHPQVRRAQSELKQVIEKRERK